MHIRATVVALELFFPMMKKSAQLDIGVKIYCQNTETSGISHHRFIRFEHVLIILCVFWPLLAPITYKTHTKHVQTNI